MSEEIPYVRIGTTYHRRVNKPTINGDEISTFVKWSKDAIIDDHGKKYLDQIPRRLGYCSVPSHLNYQEVISDFQNVYHPLPFQVFDKEIENDEILNKIACSLVFIKHVFGDQYELGLDYLKILLLHPTQILPILCLVSKERSTGKSTYLKWLKLIFGYNLTFIKGDSFSSQFNSDWANMLIVAIDEVFFDKKETTERLKYLSTTNKEKLEHKGLDRQEIDFYAKFILCSNNEDNFLIIDNEEVRFWILQLKTIKSEDTEILDKLKREIPYFLRFLKDRPFFREKLTRMWFLPEDIRTRALKKLLWKNNNLLETKIIETLYELFQNIDDNKVHLVPQDLYNLLNRYFRKNTFVVNDLRKVLKDKWKLEPQNNSFAYERYGLDYSGNYYHVNASGRYFVIERLFVYEKFDEMMR